MPQDARLEDGATGRPAMGEALSAFARRVAGEGVEVSFDGGVARIRGHVASATKARALADLVGGHEGVEAVVSELDVTSGEPAAEYSHEMT